MAANKTTYEADIVVKGVADSSLSRTLGMSVAELKKFQRAVNDISNLQNKLSSKQGGLIPEPKAFREATSQAEKFRGVLGNIATIGAGVGIGEMLARGFDFAISQAEAFAGVIGKAVEKAAEFTTMKLQLGIETGDNPQQLAELLDQLQWKANKSPFKLPALSEGIRKLMSMGFNDQDKAMQFMHSEMNLAAATKAPGESYDQHFGQINEAFAKAIAQGHIMERNLYMLENAGIKIRPWLEQKIGLPIGTMGDLQSDESLNAIRKAVRKGQLDSSMLMQFATDQTKDGAKYSDAAVAPLIRNFFGATSTFGDMADQFARGFGTALEAPFTNLVNHINDAFTWDKFKGVQAFFEKMQAASSKFFDPIVEKLVNNPEWNKTMADFSTLLERAGRDFGKLQEPLLVLADKAPKIIDFMIKFSEAIERILAAFGNAAGWINKWGDRGERITQKIQDAINPNPSGQVLQSGLVLAAQQRLNDIVNSGGSDEQIDAAKADLLKAEKAQKDQTDKTTKSLQDMQAILDKVNLSILKVGGGGSASNGSWERYTQFGPGVAGDQPGGGSYDWNSYHGIGAYGRLRKGDVAMHPAYARQHYNIGPGQTYISDKDHREHRFQDKSGAKAFNNEDFYKGASAETHVHFHIEAIDGASVHSFLNEHGDSIADRVHRHLSDRLSRSAVV